MDKVTQQNAANAEESASASEELTAQAESMNEIVAELVSLVGGGSKRNSSTPVKPPAKRRELGHSDHILHAIAGGKKDKKEQKVRPAKSHQEKTIPLSEDEGLNHFNT